MSSTGVVVRGDGAGGASEVLSLACCLFPLRCAGNLQEVDFPVPAGLRHPGQVQLVAAVRCFQVHVVASVQATQSVG